MSLIFFSLTLGVTWSSVIAFVLKLRMALAIPFILFGAVMGFVFWYWAFEYSLSFIASELLTVLSFALSLFLLFYGELKEKEELKSVWNSLRKRKH